MLRLLSRDFDRVWPLLSAAAGVDANEKLLLLYGHQRVQLDCESAFDALEQFEAQATGDADVTTTTAVDASSVGGGGTGGGGAATARQIVYVQSDAVQKQHREVLSAITFKFAKASSPLSADRLDFVVLPGRPLVLCLTDTCYNANRESTRKGTVIKLRRKDKSGVFNAGAMVEHVYQKHRFALGNIARGRPAARH